VNLAGFRNCLADYTVHSLLPSYSLLTALVLLKCYQMVQYNNNAIFYKKGVILHAFLHGLRKDFFQGGH